MMEEIWKPIKGYEGLYEISSFGRVKSLRYNRKKGNVAILKLKPRREYAGVDLCSKTFSVHKLVVEAFIGEIPQGMTVNHKDFNTKNNCYYNLEIISRGENVKHMIAHKKSKGDFSSKLPGVSYYKNTGKWRAQIKTGYEIKHIGYYQSERDAYNAVINHKNTLTTNGCKIAAKNR